MYTSLSNIKNKKFINLFLLASFISACSLPNNINEIKNEENNNEKSKLTFKTQSVGSEVFNEEAYLLAFQDIRNAVNNGSLSSAYHHYKNYGINEGRLNQQAYIDAVDIVNKGFHEDAYLNAYPDIKASIFDPNSPYYGNVSSGYEHYKLYGKNELCPTNQTISDCTNQGWGRIGYKSYTLPQNTFVDYTSLNNIYSFTNTANLSYRELYEKGYIEIDYKNAFSDLNSYQFQNNLFTHYLGYGVTEGRLTNPSYININHGSTRHTDSFNGSYIRYVAKKGTNQGKADIWIDNVYKTTVDLYSSTDISNQTVYESNLSTSGNHTIDIRPAGKNTNSTGYGVNIQDLSITPIEEFQVNSSTTDIQQNSSIASDSNGNFIVVWQSTQNGTNDIYAQRYNSNGNKVGNEFRVNNTTIGEQINPKIAMSNNEFVITWQGNQFGNNDIYAQKFNSSGSLINSEFRVNSYTNMEQTLPDISTDSNGNYYIVYQDNTYGDIDVYLKSYTNLGENEYYIATSANDESKPSISVNTNGDIAIVYQYDNDISPSESNDIYYLIATSNGIFTNIVNSYTTHSQSNPSVSMNSQGNFVVSWEGEGLPGNGVYYRRFNSNLTPQTNDNSIRHINNNEYLPFPSEINSKVFLNEQNNCAFVWEQGGDIYGRVIDSGTVSLNTNFNLFQISSSTGTQNKPSVVYKNNFISSWNGVTLNDTNGIAARRYDSNGNSL